MATELFPLEEEPVVAEIENGIDKNFDEIECKNLSFHMIVLKYWIIFQLK